MHPRKWLRAAFVGSGGSISKSANMGAIAGAVAGFIWGGFGGRIAMRIVLLTSDDRVRGLTSDDGFEIGRVSFETLSLVFLAVVLGAGGGAVYGLVRLVLQGPRWLIALGVGVTAAAIGGAIFVHPDGIDFRLLEPLWLTVGLFVFLPGAWGVTVVLLTDRLLSRRQELRLPADKVEPQVIVTPRVAGAGWLVLATGSTLVIIYLARDIAELT